MIARTALIASITALWSCALPPPPMPAKPAIDRIAIVASERGPSGIRLVAIDEQGDRRFSLVVPPETIARETHPTLSPDGRWIVFASSRDRPLDQTSLWIARLGPDVTPIRITTDPAVIDSHPAWSRDGAAIVFASTRAGSFDLWRLPIDRHGRGGTPVRLTHDDGHEVSPTVAADGTIIYTRVTHEAGIVESRLESRAPDGTITSLTEGPLDSSPALSPDGKTLAFARPVREAATLDAELWTISFAPRGEPALGGPATRVVTLPLTDETGPVWSPDGRFLFATSVLRSGSGAPLFSSVIHVELAAAPRTARILEDRLGAIARLTPAITRTPLDVAALRRDPEYLPELGRIVAEAVALQQHASDQPATEPKPASPQ